MFDYAQKCVVRLWELTTMYFFSFLRLHKYSICCIKLYFQVHCVCLCVHNTACDIIKKVIDVLNGLNGQCFSSDHSCSASTSIDGSLICNV